jgi:hypothetical protein
MLDNDIMITPIQRPFLHYIDYIVLCQLKIEYIVLQYHTIFLLYFDYGEQNVPKSIKRVAEIKKAFPGRFRGSHEY